MLSPWDLAHLSDRDATNYADVEGLVWLYIVNTLANEAKLAHTDDDSWLNTALAQAEQVRHYAATITVKPAQSASKRLHANLSSISQDNLQPFENWLKKVTGKRVNLRHGSQYFQQAVNDELTNADNYLNLARRNMSTNAYKAFRGIIGDARRLVDAGTVPNKAIMQAGQRWADQGVPALIDRAGRRWAPDVYTRMVITTSINSATNNTELARYKQYGALVKVSSHSGCRPSHLQYQDHIYSLDGDTDKYPDFESTTGYGSITGIGGINCRHYTIPYVEGYGAMPVPQQSNTENAKQYQLEQTQRRLEREVRKAKRRLAITDKFGDDYDISVAKQSVQHRQLLVRNFVKRHKLVRQYNREQ